VSSPIKCTFLPLSLSCRTKLSSVSFFFIHRKIQYLWIDYFLISYFTGLKIIFHIDERRQVASHKCFYSL
jgi:hypothetical protein